MIRPHRILPALAALVAVTLAGTPATDAASRAGRSDVKQRAPYYTGKSATDARAAHLPVRAGASFGALGANAAMTSAVGARLPEIQRFLDELSLSRPLDPGGGLDARDAAIVYVGRHDGFHAPDDGAAELEETMLGRTAVVIHVSDPPSRVGRALGERASAAGADHVLHLTLDLSDYPIAQKSWKGNKAVELGTGHTMAVPWLTSLDQMAEVIHFTGALYRADGKFVRAGAEGFHAIRTRFGESVIGLQRAHTPETIEAAFAAVRDDLPGRPLAWQVALRALVANLTGRKSPLSADPISPPPPPPGGGDRGARELVERLRGEVEREALGRPAPGVTRAAWDRLELTAGDGSKHEFKDEVRNGALARTHVYRGHVAPLDHHLVEVVFVPEGRQFLLLDRHTGAATEVDAPPVPSADGSRFVTASFDLVAGHQPNRLRVYRMEGGRPVVEWSLEPREWGPANPAWADDRTVRLDRVTVDTGTTPHVERTAPMWLERGESGWSVREPR